MNVSPTDIVVLFLLQIAKIILKFVLSFWVHLLLGLLGVMRCLYQANCGADCHGGA